VNKVERKGALVVHTDYRMEIAGQESGFEASMQGISYDSKWNQEACCIQIHACQSIHDSRTTQYKHGSDYDVGHEAEAQEHDMRMCAPSGFHNFTYGMCARCLPLDLNGQHSEQQYLQRQQQQQPITNKPDII
jgi:hypothetical protein